VTIQKTMDEEKSFGKSKLVKNRTKISQICIMSGSTDQRNQMTMASKTTSAKRKPEPASETSQSLAAQMAAFLKAGGEVQKIPNGVSGQTQGPSRQITISKK